MARWQNSDTKPSGPSDWEEAGKEALLDLLSERLVIPWHEAEARISHHGWNGFPLVQPLQLTAARRSLADSGEIVVERSETNPPVTTVRLPYLKGKKRTMERLRGERRKLYRKYLSWASDTALCGRHAEAVVFESAKGVASEAALWVPPQKVGTITEVLGHSIAPRTLDVLIFALDPETVARPVAIGVEVKNVHSWIYPWAPELWELLVKAATLADQGASILPVLVCPRASWQTWQFAQDCGFFTIQLGRQIFNPTVPAEEFDHVAAEFQLVIERHGGPDPHVQSFLTKTLRRTPPPSPPDEDIPWFCRQVTRFRTLAKTVLQFNGLAQPLPDDARSAVWHGARSALQSRAEWPLLRGW